LEGLSLEVAGQEDSSLFSDDSLMKISAGKAAALVTTIAALESQIIESDHLDVIERSINYTMMASQMLDDVGDWKEDILSGHKTHFLSLLRSNHDDFWDGTWEITDIQAKIDQSWEDVRQLNRVVEWLDQSIQLVNSLECNRWVEYVNGYRERAEMHARRFTAQHIKQAIQPLLE
jgi:hypothetical protein